MLFLGIDLGTSSVKVSVLDGEKRKVIASAGYPDEETEIITPKPGWAEQDPEIWWENVQKAVLRCHETKKYDPKEIEAIGIAYQMHGLVLVDQEKEVLRNAIIWSDGRAIQIGREAYEKIGENYCKTHLLNSPGNFTASKLGWVKKNEPEVYEKIAKILLPGDFIAMKLTGETTTTVPALSEGIFWDFKRDEISEEILKYYGFDSSLFPEIHPLFSVHGKISVEVAEELSLKKGIPVTYKSGDQPNNALALNVLNQGEVAVNGGTSGVIYGVSAQLKFDEKSRINSFAHVNYTSEDKKIGVLLNINGTGIFNSWMRKMIEPGLSYKEINQKASGVDPGSEGLLALPFGNGAERMLENKIVGSHLLHMDFNRHKKAHLLRAAQEGIAFSFRYGMDVMRANGIHPSVVRAGYTNLFLSPLFSKVFAAVNQVEIEFYEGDGSFGAAVGAGIGVGFYRNPEEALKNRQPLRTVQSDKADQKRYEELYQKWKAELMKFL